MFGEIGVGVIAAWLGSFELRIRNLVSVSRFDDYTKRMERVEDKIDALLLKNGLNPKEHDNKERSES